MTKIKQLRDAYKEAKKEKNRAEKEATRADNKYQKAFEKETKPEKALVNAIRSVQYARMMKRRNGHAH